MEQVTTILQTYMAEIMIGLITLSAIFLVLSLVCLSKLAKVQKKYQAFMQREDVDLEALLTSYATKVNQLEANEREMKQQIKKIQDELKFCVRKVGVVRYKAMEDMGSDLSFAVALLDGYQNGVVINGIYSRDGSYTYAKPVQAGQSKYRLSDEEAEAVSKTTLILE